MLAAPLTRRSITQVDSRTLRQIALTGKRKLRGVPHHARRVSSSQRRLPAGGRVSFTRTPPRDLELPSAGVVESGIAGNGFDPGWAPRGERRRGRWVFAAQLLGGLTQGGSGSDPSTRKPRTDAENGLFFYVEHFVRITGGSGRASTFCEFRRCPRLILRVFVRLSVHVNAQFLDDEKRRETKHDDV